MIDEVKVQSAKSVPALAGAVFTLNEWVAIFTIFYISLQAAYLIWKWVRQVRSGGIAE